MKYFKLRWRIFKEKTKLFKKFMAMSVDETKFMKFLIDKVEESKRVGD